MIFLTGDTHADFSRFIDEIFPIQSELTKNDYVIVCGDFNAACRDYRKIVNLKDERICSG